MERYERILIGPSRQELEQALGETVTLANEGARTKLLPWPPADMPKFWNRFESTPEGWQQWVARSTGNRTTSKGRSGLFLAWWTDFAGRRHCHIIGCRGAFRGPQLTNLVCGTTEPKPPLWVVYPESTFLYRGTDSPPTLLALCACGALGRPEELGWMGTCCGPCHDRREEGLPPAAPWMHPRLAQLGGLNDPVALAFSPDSSLLLAADTKTLTVWDLALGDRRLRWLEQAYHSLSAADFSTDSKQLLLNSGGLVRRLDVATGETLFTRQFGYGGAGPEWSPDGILLAISRGDFRSWYIEFWRSAEERLVGWFGPERGGGPARLRFSPDGKLLAVGTVDGTIEIWNVPDGEERGRCSLGDGEVGDLRFSPDGLTLAAALQPAEVAPEQQAARVSLWDIPGQRQRGTLTCSSSPHCLTWSPEGRYVLVGDDTGQVAIWDTVSASALGTLQWHMSAIVIMAISPNGKLLATADASSKARLWPWDVLLARMLTRR
jgi:dipeptidyl aminopeptidase/acylaminoacyl peptidase